MIKNILLFTAGDRERPPMSTSYYLILFTQPLRSGRIWHKVNF